MESLRRTFDSSASRYHQARPRYPEELFDALFKITGIGHGAQVLEIGPGTGIATEPLARRGVSIHGIELGSELAEKARNNLKTFPTVQIDVGEFETFSLVNGFYDLVLAATSFHWVRQPIGFCRVRDALCQGGHFVEFRHHHVWSSESNSFYHAAQRLYEEFDPATQPGLRLPAPNEIETLETTLAETGLFEPAIVRRYIQNVIHSADTYRDLLWTFSGHIALPEPNRSRLIDGIAKLIQDDFGGRITKTHLVMMHIAQVR